MVHVLLAVHRELTWGDLESALEVCADADVRIRSVEIETPRSGKAPRRAIPVHLRARYPVRVKHPVPLIEIRMGKMDLTPGHRAALEDMLLEGAWGQVETGILVEIDPAAGVEPALRLLMSIAQADPPEILCYAKAGLPAKLMWHEIEVEPDPSGEPAESPVTLPLTVDFR
jgi:hypothetical protein